MSRYLFDHVSKQARAAGEVECAKASSAQVFLAVAIVAKGIVRLDPTQLALFLPARPHQVLDWVNRRVAAFASTHTR